MDRENFVCVQSLKECPITSIRIRRKNATDLRGGEKAIRIGSYGSKEHDDMELVFSKTPYNLPLSKFVVEES